MGNKKLKYTISIIKLILLLLFIVVIPLYIFTTYPEMLSDLKDLKATAMYLEKYKSHSIPIYLGLQVLQVLVSVIPGQVLQLAGGYIFRFFLGLILTFTGLSLGTVVTFFFARIMGKNAMHVLLGEEKLNYFIEIFNSKRAYFILFVIFLIPGIPKDLCCYAAGISEIKLKPFLILSIVGRTPGIIGSVAIGEFLYTGSYTGVIILAASGFILFVLGAIYRKKILEKTNCLYEKWAGGK